jgi:hypothetical protein
MDVAGQILCRSSMRMEAGRLTAALSNLHFSVQIWMVAGFPEIIEL